MFYRGKSSLCFRDCPPFVSFHPLLAPVVSSKPRGLVGALIRSPGALLPFGSNDPLLVLPLIQHSKFAHIHHFVILPASAHFYPEHLGRPQCGASCFIMRQALLTKPFVQRKETLLQMPTRISIRKWHVNDKNKTSHCHPTMRFNYFPLVHEKKICSVHFVIFILFI